jgi:predicted methyltransferase
MEIRTARESPENRDLKLLLTNYILESRKPVSLDDLVEYVRSSERPKSNSERSFRYRVAKILRAVESDPRVSVVTLYPSTRSHTKLFFAATMDPGLVESELEKLTNEAKKALKEDVERRISEYQEQVLAIVLKDHSDEVFSRTSLANLMTNLYDIKSTSYLLENVITRNFFERFFVIGSRQKRGKDIKLQGRLDVWAVRDFLE